ncbi:phosphoribosylformylglycinamidine synthase [Flavobacterium bomense]|uniref:Phosphoribosylformylglycinamidine synthase n=1 Tax=Flavobacterium bomense TaxID=2497483 RepID=A0A3S0MIL9_9FLAO|nr:MULTISPECIES: HAEPLYID family protein [Flavobacterium]RTY85642.1 phosphoribosylformylglycinamidine synthase [Flavobacterium sp. RSP15]RTZ04924.1 phosphoribosylformylglycinamidine synthase [Flavobacterium bomense]
MALQYLKTAVFTLLLTVLTGTHSQAQTEKNQQNTIKDSLYIQEVEGKKKRPKVLHAEPLYIDLIRDLGARKGEKEWNLGLGLTDNITHDEYTALLEYEWAPIDRLGLEVELPFSIYYPTSGNGNSPGSNLNSIKLAAQYTFFVSEKKKISMAVGYIHEFLLPNFNNYSNSTLITGNGYNPFLVIAKRWGQNFHTLLYTGPQFTHHFSDNTTQTNWQINSNIHYMIPGTRNFIGLEFNKEINNADFDMTIRPQMRVEITDNLLIGIVTGIPINRENQRFSSFLRLIYEPSSH